MHPNLVRKCLYIQERLRTHELAWPFLNPVDPVALNLPTYFEEVPNPMDLRTMGWKLEQNMYATPYEYRQDMVLMFENAIHFNRKDTSANSVSALAKKLLHFGLEIMQETFTVEEMQQSDSERNEPQHLTAALEANWTKQVSAELINRAKQQNLWKHWKKSSFVARINRLKIERNKGIAAAS